jgi:DNA-directed RNA polymerase specialized sigma24 family protein
MHLSYSRAEDVLQHTLLQAWLALAGGAEVRELKPWLYRIVHNTAVNAMRRSVEDHGQLTDAMQAAKGAVGESDLDRRIAVRDALTDVAALPQMQRQAILLSAVEGQTHDELTSALGISHGLCAACSTGRGRRCASENGSGADRSGAAGSNPPESGDRGRGIVTEPHR